MVKKILSCVRALDFMRLDQYNRAFPEQGCVSSSVLLSFFVRRGICARTSLLFFFHRNHDERRRRQIFWECTVAVSGRYPSGQRGQTVNLLPSASKVRILACPPNRACVGRRTNYGVSRINIFSSVVGLERISTITRWRRG